MAPKVARAAVAVATVQDNSAKQIPETAPAKEKETHPTTKAHTNAKQRRTGGSGSGAHDKSSNPPKGSDPNAHMKLQWTSFDRKILHTYRREYRLDTPTAFSNSYHHRILTLSGGVGKHSPTMVHRNRAAGPSRQTKEQLAHAIRKHFNSLSVAENDVIAHLIHKVRQDDADATRRRLTRRGGEHS